MKSSREKSWERFHRWENGYKKERLRGLTPLERIRIYEELYRVALKLHPDKVRYQWRTDEEALKNPHLRHLTEWRHRLLKEFK
ncbi:hypothetical protein [Candidatus Hakubella thermalkaliphila]|uniref:hypothetical protein n=1 Tax=Candidatus Hakubella thermalkaliphila TaxID=2754717 RepID=UPI001C611EC3|nr:hypothetical protein [Candidatus Hakubella thermalkaliphila]